MNLLSSHIWPSIPGPSEPSAKHTEAWRACADWLTGIAAGTGRLAPGLSHGNARCRMVLVTCSDSDSILGLRLWQSGAKYREPFPIWSSSQIKAVD